MFEDQDIYTILDALEFKRHDLSEVVEDDVLCESTRQQARSAIEDIDYAIKACKEALKP